MPKRSTSYKDTKLDNIAPKKIAKKCIILIDGSNFYHKLKDLNLSYLINFNFSSFVNFLAEDLIITESIYFVGKIRTDSTPKANKLLKNQQKLLNHLKKNNLKYLLGYLLKTGKEYHEKGVDVNIATHVLVAAYENLADRIIIISSDTDLIPAIKKAKEIGKIVEYIGFKHKPSMAMITNCSRYKLLSKNDIEKFLNKKSRKQH